MSWDSKGHKSFGRAQGRWVKGGKLRATTDFTSFENSKLEADGEFVMSFSSRSSVRRSYLQEHRIKEIIVQYARNGAGWQQ